jgi:predicted transcriptional regulator
MKAPCEIIVLQILPHVRALVAIELKETYHLKGVDIARLVGTTRAAVSQYHHGVRGKYDAFIHDFPEIPDFVQYAAKELSDNCDTDMELSEKLGVLCTAIKDNETFRNMCSTDSQRLECRGCL